MKSEDLQRAIREKPGMAKLNPTLTMEFWAANPSVKASGSASTAIDLPEREIQDQIEAFLRSLGPECYYVRSRMDKPTTNAVGTPDFIGWYLGTPFAFEVKRKGRKPTPEQQAKLAWCHRAGAVNVCVVNSVDRVSEMLTATQNAPPDFVKVLEDLGNDPMARIDARVWAKHFRKKLSKH